MKPLQKVYFKQTTYPQTANDSQTYSVKQRSAAQAATQKSFLSLFISTGHI